MEINFNIMKKYILLYGPIAGLIPGLSFYIMHQDGNIQMDMENGEMMGFALMIFGLSSIFIATKQYRDALPNGKITFGKAFLIGLFISLFASVVYAISWEIFLNHFDLKFGELYQSYQEKVIAQGNMSQEQIAEAINSSSQMMQLYDNNLFVRFGFTMAEILPIGILVSLLSAALFSWILKTKQP